MSRPIPSALFTRVGLTINFLGSEFRNIVPIGFFSSRYRNCAGRFTFMWCENIPSVVRGIERRGLGLIRVRIKGWGRRFFSTPTTSMPFFVRGHTGRPKRYTGSFVPNIVSMDVVCVFRGIGVARNGHGELCFILKVLEGKFFGVFARLPTIGGSNREVDKYGVFRFRVMACGLIFRLLKVLNRGGRGNSRFYGGGRDICNLCTSANVYKGLSSQRVVPYVKVRGRTMDAYTSSGGSFDTCTIRASYGVWCRGCGRRILCATIPPGSLCGCDGPRWHRRL